VLWACVAGYALSPLVLLFSRVRSLPRIDVA
jgi:predicted PurR-regulated permease PerM